MKRLTAYLIAIGVTLIVAPSGYSDERYDGPIIDMHQHAFPIWYGEDGRPPPSDCYGEPCIPVHTASMSDDDLLRMTIEEMDKNRIVLAFLSGQRVLNWKQAAPERFIASAMIRAPGAPDVDQLRSDYASGRLQAMGEIGTQYAGIAPNAAALQPYFSLAAELDLPVLIHMGGNGAPRPDFRVAAGNPILLEDVLVRRRGMRLYVENCGFPFSSEMIAIMYQYPELYCDVSTITWMFRREVFIDHFERLVRAGLHKRIMFGSDQVIWPESISIAVETIQSISFLTREQRADIFYGNAARFLRLTDADIAIHHAQ